MKKPRNSGGFQSRVRLRAGGASWKGHGKGEMMRAAQRLSLTALTGWMWLACSSQPGSSATLGHDPDEVGTSAKALTDPSGPDLACDQGRLQASLRVLADQSLT